MDKKPTGVAASQAAAWDIARQLEYAALTCLNDAGTELMLKANAEIESQDACGRWIPVTERLPENGDVVWCFDADGVGLCEYHGPLSGFQSYGASCDTEGLNSETLIGVTHWMELQHPEPPDSRTANTTDLDAAPAARARTDADTGRTDKAVTGPGEGTGDTVPYSRTDEKRVNWPTIRDTTQPRNGALSDGPDPDSRVWETQRTPQPHATPQRGSVQGECGVRDSRTENEPVAWAVMEPDGFGIEGTFTNRDEAADWCDNRQEIVPLYRKPTLTDAEREAIDRAACAFEYDDDNGECAALAATLRALLERLK